VAKNGVKEAEALSLREALSRIKDAGMGNVDIDDMDSQIVYHAITSPSLYFAFGLLIDDVKDLAFAIAGVEFRFVKRFAN